MCIWISLAWKFEFETDNSIQGPKIVGPGKLLDPANIQAIFVSPRIRGKNFKCRESISDFLNSSENVSTALLYSTNTATIYYRRRLSRVGVWNL